jgi:hypothetical protein
MYIADATHKSSRLAWETMRSVSTYRYHGSDICLYMLAGPMSEREKLTEVVYSVIVWLTVTCSVYVDTDVYSFCEQKFGKMFEGQAVPE